MDHAAAWETSCMMYAYPHSVDMSQLDGKDMSDVENREIYLPDKPTGMSGENPITYASQNMGKKIIETMGDLIGQKAVDILNEINTKE